MKFLTVIGLIILILPFQGCIKPGDQEKLQSQVDSLRNELETSQEMAETLSEVSVLMDSIDANRQAIRINMVEGTTYAVTVNRMQGLNRYVRETQKKITELEKNLKRSRAAAKAYAATIASLKAEIASKDEEIARLNETIEKFRNENQNLLRVAELQEMELEDAQPQIESKKRELTVIERRIEEVLQNSQISEAEGLYARGLAVEETANRTKLAPKKRKATLLEALELYKKAQSLGHTGAKAKIKELEAEINK